MRTMEEDLKNQGFDITVTHRDPQSGLITRQDPYTLIVCGDAHQRLWERPKNSGNVYDRQGRPCGRYIRDPKTGKGEYKSFEDHVVVAPVLSNEDQARNAIHQKDTKIAELELKLIELERKQTASKHVKPKAALKADEV